MITEHDHDHWASLGLIVSSGYPSVQVDFFFGRVPSTK